MTELVARPLLALLFPHLTSIVQPLGGEYAGRRELLEQLPFVEGYGVDIGLLIDIAAGFGTDVIAQVDLGTRVHRNRPLDELSPQATAIMQTALRRAGRAAPVAQHARAPRPRAARDRCVRIAPTRGNSLVLTSRTGSRRISPDCSSAS